MRMSESGAGHSTHQGFGQASNHSGGEAYQQNSDASAHAISRSAATQRLPGGAQTIAPGAIDPPPHGSGGAHISVMA
jgi:hypothetical protein